MKLRDNIWIGIQQGIRFRRIAIYILLIQLLLATMIGVLAYNYIQDAIGHTTQLMKIIDGYDHDVFQDLLLFESTGWSMIKAFSWVVIGLYLLIGPFIMGGLLLAFKDQQDHWETFWKGGSRHYFSFLKLNIIVLGFLLLTFIILGAAGLSFTLYGLQHFLTELPMLYGVSGLFFVFLLIGIVLVSTSTRAKWIIICEQEKIWTAFKMGFKQVRQQLFYFLFLGLFFLILSIGFAMAINLLINRIPESGFLLVLLALGMQVIALFIRVCLRNAYYGSILQEPTNK